MPESEASGVPKWEDVVAPAAWAHIQTGPESNTSDTDGSSGRGGIGGSGSNAQSDARQGNISSQDSISPSSSEISSDDPTSRSSVPAKTAYMAPDVIPTPSGFFNHPSSSSVYDSSSTFSAVPSPTGASVDASNSGNGSGSGSSNGMSTNTKVAIAVPVAVGGALIIAAIIFLVLWLQRRKQRKQQQQQEKGESQIKSQGDHSGIDMTSAPAPVAGWSTPVAPPAPAPAPASPPAAVTTIPRFPFEKPAPASSQQGPRAEHGIGMAVTPDHDQAQPATSATGFHDLSANHSRTQSPFNDPDDPDDDDALSAVSRFSDRPRGDVGTGSIRSAVSAVSDDHGNTGHGHGHGNNGLT